MAENEIITNPNTDQENQDYIDAINELKNNSVSKDKYDRVIAENKKLLKSLTSGEQIEVPAPKTPTIEETVAPLADRSSELFNLDWAEKTMAFREAVMSRGLRDPFLPQGPGVVPTDRNRENARAMETALKHCIEKADGDNAVFLAEWNKIYQPDPMRMAGRR